MKRIFSFIVILTLALTAVGACAAAETCAEELPGLQYLYSMDRKYAEQFEVHYYEDGFKLLLIGDGNRYLLVPEGKEPPEKLDESIRVLQQPLDSIYLAATAAMSLFAAIDSLDVITLTSLDAEEWYVEAAREAMEREEIFYGGKYSEPDYEALIELDADLTIENTMILHAPKVKEQIERLGIPVFVDRSSYEPHPLGRTEWMKLYGAMLNREAEAEAVFQERTAVMEDLKNFPDTGKTAAIFFIDSTGTVQVRSPSDYISRILELAGGHNVFSSLELQEKSGNIRMTMEQFYASARNADFLIYNSGSWGEGVDSMEKMLEKSPLLADFRAAEEGKVWWLGGETYQLADRLADLVLDIHRMLIGAGDGMMFLHPME
ncbi:MAG: ABC transporter substrate-binding protein [Oscillospiraceae bacterium]|nr:ABC transporter substrate-binding protein [Oscillospiraceae bacterium]